MCANNLVKSTYFVRYCVELDILSKDSPTILASFAIALSICIRYLPYSFHVDMDIHLDEKLRSCYCYQIVRNMVQPINSPFAFRNY
jgi:hypothetical protein